jgi:short subunit dehydrogenase-like uncharacterized protein
MAADRELDAVLYGATGFVVKYTADTWSAAPPRRRASVSPAARKRSSGAYAQGSESAPLIVADSQDAAALSTMAQRTKVIATTVGPYATYGMDLVEACAKGGTHYADLTAAASTRSRPTSASCCCTRRPASSRRRRCS